MIVDVLRVDQYVCRLSLVLVGGLVRHRLQQALHHGMQPPCADVLGALVDLEGDLGDAADAVLRKFDLHALGGHQRPVLGGERGIRLGEDAHEVADLE